MGNIKGTLDSNGQAVVQYKYDAWGNHKVYNNAQKEDTDSHFIGNLNPFRYRSYYYDTETKLYYLKTRYYDPEVGRFINMDSIEYADPQTINGLNLYAYCGNNPVMNEDSTGTIFGVLIALGIGAVVGAVVGGVKAKKEGATVGEIIGNVVLGAAVGLAVAGAVVTVGAVAAGAVGATSFLGATTAQAFALGTAAFDIFGAVVSPILGVSMDLIEMGGRGSRYASGTSWYTRYKL